MSVSVKDVDYTAQLAHLSIDKEHKDKFINQMSQIIDYFEQLNELDTDNVAPTFNVLDLSNALREDIAVESNITEEVLKHAPKVDGKYFCVPTTVEKK